MIAVIAIQQPVFFHSSLLGCSRFGVPVSELKDLKSNVLSSK